ncbi:MAG TPA: sugar phosphate isomerase/epimerase family protein [Candidatus Latescibacteria bacterium]|nr:sugar phosphate isomerase/epimerase family protein [Candidatus Latescibacterota bacterium]HOS64777.1 sugar phosphate isomerase/epimerase family protein [Candidatus Latescibacterota bacterium]HPK73555.1 sugar phosphate isomerase/epimerase family protein [Candidatus Latescibacterota bacterium]
MGNLKVGVMIESFGLGVRNGIKKAAEIGADGFQIYVTGGEMHPDNLSKTGRQEFLKFVADQGLVISALCGDFGKPYTKEEGLDELITDTKKVIDLAVDLKTPIITTHIGVVDADPKARSRQIMADALNNVGAYADNRGIMFATETGPEPGPVLADFIKSLKTQAVKANFDPANLAMMGFDVLEGVRALGPYIVHTHAKDGIREDGRGKEVPLGEGAVPWEEYIDLMTAQGYRGFYTIEREVGDDPAADVKKALDFLRKW